MGTDSDDLEGAVLRAWPIHQPEPGRSVTGEVELDPCSAGQIPADVTVTEKLPGDSAVREVLKYGQGRVEAFPVKDFKVGCNRGVWKMSWYRGRRGGSATSGATAQALDQRGDRVGREPITAVPADSVLDGSQIEVVLRLLKQPLPDASRHDDGLRATMGAEVDGMGVACVEPLSDAV